MLFHFVMHSLDGFCFFRFINTFPISVTHPKSSSPSWSGGVSLEPPKKSSHVIFLGSKTYSPGGWMPIGLVGKM